MHGETMKLKHVILQLQWTSP